MPALEPVDLPPLYLITDGRRLGKDGLRRALEAAIRGGVAMVQIREKHLPRAELRGWIEEFLRASPPGIRWIVNRDWELAVELSLSGAHLGGDAAALARAREGLRAGQLLGYSAHSLEEARRAVEMGADYVSFSPVYPPLSKPAYGPPQGLEALRRVCRELVKPVFALGGIRWERLEEIKCAGAFGVGVIGAILDAPSPENAARRLLAAWEGRKVEAQ